MSAASLAGWAFDGLVASALLMAAVLLIRKPVRRAFGPQVAYALWALPVLRLLLPPLPAHWRAAAVTPISRATETISIVFVPAGPSTASVATTHWPSAGQIAVLLWVGGALAFLAWHFVRHTRFCRATLARGHALRTVDGIRVIESAVAPGPLAFGVVRRYVAFPRDFAERYDADERSLALAHEIGHHRRGDLIANWIALAVLSVHWFNPLAWRAFHAFRADQELANDAGVLAGRSLYERHAYACAIVKAAHGGSVSAACHLHTIADLKGRLKMLSVSRTSRRRLVTGGASVAALVTAGLGLTASGTSAATIVTTSIERTTGVTLAQADVLPPAPPAPPAVPDGVTAPVSSPPPVPPVPPVHGVRNTQAVTVITDANGPTVRTHVIHKGGPMTVDMPEVVEGNCPDAGARPLVVDTQRAARARS